ncbi:tetratricopeptide repeat protein [Sphingomonas sp.]|uniref:tetratricopeptide repeat protein n=1 Tax=Sphingomonas sp. TaxID=28214 RepID=UPI003341E0E9
MKFAHFGLIALAAAALCASTAAVAADEGNGAVQIMKGDYVAAERIIRDQAKIFPGDPDLLLNLASVYRHTGRMSEARALYRAVLARPDELMDLPDTAVPQTAHTLASAALGSMDAPQLTAR